MRWAQYLAPPLGELASVSETERVNRCCKALSVTCGDSSHLRAKSRLRRLRYETRLRAQPEGEPRSREAAAQRSLIFILRFENQGDEEAEEHRCGDTRCG